MSEDRIDVVGARRGGPKKGVGRRGEQRGPFTAKPSRGWEPLAQRLFKLERPGIRRNLPRWLEEESISQHASPPSEALGAWFGLMWP